jgi:hypothetical protein
MNEIAERTLYQLTVFDRPGETLAVTVRWEQDGIEHIVTLRLTESDHRVPQKVLRNVREMIYTALHRRRTAKLFQLIKDGQ